MAGRDNPFDMQIKLLMIGDSGSFSKSIFALTTWNIELYLCSNQY